MPLYKFYRIVPKDVSKTDCYIGHTIQPLRKRFTAHYMKRNVYGACKSSILFERYGRDGLQIVLIHELELASREEALREERRLYEEYKEWVVNKYKPHVTDEERRILENQLRSKRYHEKDEKNDEQRIEYRKMNRERQAIVSKQWREANKEVILQKKKEYYEANKVRMLEQQRIKYAFHAGLKYFARISLE